MTTTDRTPFTSETTINDLLRVRPAAITVLNRYGLDACCGGGLALAEAARRHGLDLDRLMAELCEA